MYKKNEENCHQNYFIDGGWMMVFACMQKYKNKKIIQNIHDWRKSNELFLIFFIFVTKFNAGVIVYVKAHNFWI